MGEFLDGCLRLRGPAKAVDLALLLKEVKQLTRAFQAHFLLIEGLVSDGKDGACTNDETLASISPRLVDGTGTSVVGDKAGPTAYALGSLDLRYVGLGETLNPADDTVTSDVIGPPRVDLPSEGSAD